MQRAGLGSDEGRLELVLSRKRKRDAHERNELRQDRPQWRFQSVGLELSCLSGTRGTADAINKCNEIGAVLIGDRGELNAEAPVRNGILNDSFGPDLAFGDEKIYTSS